MHSALVDYTHSMLTATFAHERSLYKCEITQFLHHAINNFVFFYPCISFFVATYLKCTEQAADFCSVRNAAKNNHKAAGSHSERANYVE